MRYTSFPSRLRIKCFSFFFLALQINLFHFELSNFVKVSNPTPLVKKLHIKQINLQQSKPSLITEISFSPERTSERRTKSFKLSRLCFCEINDKASNFIVRPFGFFVVVHAPCCFTWTHKEKKRKKRIFCIRDSYGNGEEDDCFEGEEAGHEGMLLLSYL